MVTFFIEKGQTEDFQSGFVSRFHTTIPGGKIFSMPVTQGSIVKRTHDERGAQTRSNLHFEMDEHICMMLT